jgi:hypothetical protein
MLLLEGAAARRSSPAVVAGTYEQRSASQRGARLRRGSPVFFLDTNPPPAVSTVDAMALYYGNTLEMTQPSGGACARAFGGRQIALCLQAGR